MPLFHIATNVARADIPDGFMKRITEVMAKQTEKPEEGVMVHVLPDQLMIRGGTSAPCAECYFNCVGKVSEQDNISHTKALMEVINEDLNIDKDRMYIFFTDVDPANCGWNGTTVAAIMKQLT